MSMDDYPRVIYKEYEENDESGAVNVDRILKELYNLEGELANRNTQLIYKSKLRKLLNYVTLIGYTEISNYFVFEEHKMRGDLLVYFFNENVIELLGYQLLMFNGDYKTVEEVYIDYQVDCIRSGLCLVYNIDTTYGETVYELNGGLSDLRYMCIEKLDLRLSI